jgi:predicted transposase YdaD
MSSKPYDVTAKDLMEDYPADWVSVLGPWQVQTATWIDTDVSTVSAASDKILKVEDGSTTWLLHVEAQANHDLELAQRVYFYNTLFHYRHKLLVRSVIVLLRPEASASNLTGQYVLQFDGEAAYLDFRYRVVRVWELPVEPLLQGGLGTLPLAPITDEAAGNLGGVFAKIRQRLDQEATPTQANKLITSAYLLLGLIYTPEQIAEFFTGFTAMKESSTYQAILAEGEQKGLVKGEIRGAIKEAKTVLLSLGTKMLGNPDTQTQNTIDAIQDLDQLHALLIRLADVSTWPELLS